SMGHHLINHQLQSIRIFTGSFQKRNICCAGANWPPRVVGRLRLPIRDTMYWGITLSFVSFVKPRKPISQSLQVAVFRAQERRDTPLMFLQKCLRHDAWLGEAYSFWREQVDADQK